LDPEALSHEKRFFPGRSQIDPAKGRRAADAAQPDEGDREFGGPVALRYVPAGMINRPGFSFSELSEIQRGAGEGMTAGGTAGTGATGEEKDPSGCIRR
jgi:hypothetical protein